jgi:hypothetical protein
MIKEGRIVERLFQCKLRFAACNLHPVFQSVSQRREAIKPVARDRFGRREDELCRIERFAIVRYSEIQMRSGREAAGTHVAYHLALIHPGAGFHCNF